MHVTRWSRRTAISERSAIENPKAFHRLFWGYLVKAVVITSALAMLLPDPDDVGLLKRACIVAVVVPVSFVAAAAKRRAAMAYFDGYIDGQAATVKNVHEALVRQMDLDDWLVSERERQLVHIAQRHNPDFSQDG